MKKYDLISVIDFELTAPPARPIRVRSLRGAWIMLRLRGYPIGWMKLDRKECRRPIDPRDVVRYATERHSVRMFDLMTAPHTDVAPELLPSMSVVVCTRNHPDVLRRQLESLAKLNYAGSYEVVVVDNAPPNNDTLDVCRGFPFVKYVLEATPGLDFARNAGWKAAKGEIICYTDDDARVDPNWLTAIARNFLKPEVHCVTGLTLPMELASKAQHYFEIYGGMQRGFVRKVYQPTRYWSKWYPLGAGAYGAGVNMSVRRKVIEELGGFDNALDTGSLTRGGGDLDMMARVLKNRGHLVYEPAAIAWHQHRKTMQQLRQQMWDYGFGFYAYLGKYARHDYELGNHAVNLMTCWYGHFVQRFWQGVKQKVKRKRHFPLHLQLYEMAGALFGWRIYEKAVAHADALERGRVAKLAEAAKQINSTTARKAA